MIRKLRPDDRRQLEIILRSLPQFTLEEVGVALELIDIAINNPSQEDYYIFVCEQKDIIQGYYCIGKRPLTNGVFDLYWIAVAAETQHQGIGTLLLENAEAFVLARNGRWVIAETSSKESYKATRYFYLRNGYNEVANIRDFYAPGDDLIIYGKLFNK